MTNDEDRLTQRLLALDPSAVRSATEHPFLHSAGNGTLDSSRLSRWLTQDRLYGLMGYTRLMGGLMSKLPSYDVGPDHPRAVTMWKRLRVISGAMANITREMGFFEDVARRNGLALDSRGVGGGDDALLGLLNATTRGYIDYMANIAANGTFEEALVLLWSMEVLYLRAWSYAARVKAEEAGQGAAAAAEGEPRVKAALDELIPNWASKDFEAFVEEIAQLVDELEGVAPGTEGYERVEKVWKTCLWFEVRFWDA